MMSLFNLKKSLAKVFACVAILITATTASATIITFGDLNLDRLDLAGTQTEGGFSYVGLGDGWELQNIFSQSGAALATFFNSEGSDVGDAVSFSNNNGDLFSFESIDWRSVNNSSNNDHVLIEGFLGGSLVDSLTIDENIIDFTQLIGFGGILDELTITINSVGDSALIFDNLNLSAISVTVPEPQALMLIFAGLIFLGRRKFKENLSKSA